MTGPGAARGPRAVARFLRPRSVAIVGMSARAGSAGQVILQSLKLNDFKGDIHLVGRSAEPIDGRPVLKSPDELPEGVDLAVCALPAAGVLEAIEACARRKVGSAMIFAAGFAEVGDQATQDAVAATARAAGLAVVGPNCLGMTNNVDGMWLHMLYPREARRGVEGGVAFVGQSGGLLGHFQRAADGLGLPLSYVISTGNEAGLEGTDFVEFLAEDPSTRVIALYCEQIRRPAEFLAALRRARAAAKPVVLMQAGRGAKARKAAQSHTGALIGDFATMRTQVEDAGAIVVYTMDEMMDLIQILVRYPDPPAKGPGILTASGAYVGLTNDFAEEVGLELPELEPATLKKVSEVLPAYGNYGNPLDVTAGFAPDALSVATKALLDDPNTGTLAARPRRHGSRAGEPGRVLAIVGSHDACHSALYALWPHARPSEREHAARADQGAAQARQGRAARMAGQAGSRSRRRSGAQRRPCPHRRRSDRSGQADRLSGGAQGAGRDAVAQDQSGRRHLESCR
jgi:acyl-CoA synthetase (NDP forming)